MSATWIVLMVAPALAAAAAIALLIRSPLAARLADRPNERSLHTHPTPRIGGLAILLAVAPVPFLFPSAEVTAVVGCAAGLAVVSFLDDLQSLPVAVRLAAHAVAAGVALAALSPPFSVALLLAAALAIVWSANLYNFMDGSDGLAGGMAVIGFGTLAGIAAAASQVALAAACIAIASAAAGFLVFNMPPARVFMGDAGSVPLGFLAGAFAVHGTASGAWPFWLVPLVFAPFVADASVTLVRRLVRGERIWIAHRTHYYQRLVLSGWSRRHVMLGAWALMLACAGASHAALGAGEMVQCAIILGVWVALAVIFLAIDVRLARGRVNNNKNSPPEP